MPQPPFAAHMDCPAAGEMGGDGVHVRDGGPREAALVVRDTARDLAALARRHRHGMLGYLLDLVVLEADETLNGRSGG